MSPDASADAWPPTRQAFRADLEQLRLQVELMMLRVDQQLEAMREDVEGGLGRRRVDDAEVDAMHASLTERCYEIIAREGPKASDLRLLVSALRVVDEVERIGGLSARVSAAVAGEPSLAVVNEPAVDVLAVLAGEAVDRYRLVQSCWGDPADPSVEHLTDGSPSAVLCRRRLDETLEALSGPSSVDAAVRTIRAAEGLLGIIDRTTALGHRIAYLRTGDRAHLLAEVR